MKNWTQLSDLKGMNNSVARLYGITALHKNILIDPNGIIIAKDMSGTELGNTLSAILD